MGVDKDNTLVSKQWGEGLWILTMMVLCWTFAAVLGWRAYVEEMRLGGDTSQWPPVTATIVESSIKMGAPRKCLRAVRFKVSYAYTTHGETMTRCFPYNNVHQSPQEFVAAHPKGQQFQIYVNPDNPEQVSFEPVNTLHPMVMWIMSSLLIGISLLLCCKGVFSWLEEDSRIE